MAHTETKPSFMRSQELSEAIPYSQNHIRRLEAAGKFPKRVQIGDNRVGWVRAEVEQWINDRLGARRSGSVCLNRFRCFLSGFPP
jgi:prophage regulatory protein